MIEQIAKPDFEIEPFAILAINQEPIRDEIVKHMRSNPDIMVYYHCYYVVAKASLERPDLFYKYWDEIAALLKHENSYHRNFALEILANLTKVDHEDRFSQVFPDYFRCLDDKKFMTGQCCARNSLKVLENHRELMDQLIPILLDLDGHSSYPIKQKELLKCDLLEVFAHFYKEIGGNLEVNEFIQSAVHSQSPKTRKKAKELVLQYHLAVSLDTAGVSV